MANKIKRYAEVTVRKTGTDGRFIPEIFEVMVTNQGGYHLMKDEIFAHVRKKGFEPDRILETASSREYL